MPMTKEQAYAKKTELIARRDQLKAKIAALRDRIAALRQNLTQKRAAELAQAQSDDSSLREIKTAGGRTIGPEFQEKTTQASVPAAKMAVQPDMVPQGDQEIVNQTKGGTPSTISPAGPVPAPVPQKTEPYGPPMATEQRSQATSVQGPPMAQPPEMFTPGPQMPEPPLATGSFDTSKEFSDEALRVWRQRKKDKQPGIGDYIAALMENRLTQMPGFQVHSPEEVLTTTKPYSLERLQALAENSANGLIGFITDYAPAKIKEIAFDVGPDWEPLPKADGDGKDKIKELGNLAAEFIGFPAAEFINIINASQLGYFQNVAVFGKEKADEIQRKALEHFIENPAGIWMALGVLRGGAEKFGQRMLDRQLMKEMPTRITGDDIAQLQKELEGNRYQEIPIREEPAWLTKAAARERAARGVPIRENVPAERLEPVTVEPPKPKPPPLVGIPSRETPPEKAAKISERERFRRWQERQTEQTPPVDEVKPTQVAPEPPQGPPQRPESELTAPESNVDQVVMEIKNTPDGTLRDEAVELLGGGPDAVARVAWMSRENLDYLVSGGRIGVRQVEKAANVSRETPRIGPEPVKESVAGGEQRRGASVEAAPSTPQPVDMTPPAKQFQPGEVGPEIVEKPITEPKGVPDALQREKGIEAPKAETEKVVEPAAVVEQTAGAEQPPAVPERPATAKAEPTLVKAIEGRISNVPIKDIATDVDRFQNRITDYSQKTVEAIENSYDPNKFDPVVLWKSPEGETFVLSGHSRLEGVKRLGHDSVPARYFEGTEEQAMNFAKIEANRLVSAESLAESVAAYQRARAQKYTQKKLTEIFDGDVKFLDAIQNLDKNGKFMEIAGQPASSEFPYIKRMARWMGELRRDYPQLTNRHESQIFDFLYKEKNRNYEMGKDNFNNLISRQVSRIDFDPNVPLTLKKGDVPRVGTLARKDTGWIEEKIAEFTKRRDEAKTVAEREALQKEIDKMREGVRQLVKGQKSLFDQPEVIPEPKQELIKTPKAETKAEPQSIFEPVNTEPMVEKQSIFEPVNKEPAGKSLNDLLEPAPTAKSVKNDLFEPVEKPKTKTATAQAAELPKATPKKSEIIEEPPTDGMTGLSLKETERLRKFIGRPLRDPVVSKSFNQSAKAARDAGYDKDALNIADQVIKSKGKRILTDEEHAGMVLRADELVKEREDLSKTITALEDRGDFSAADNAQTRLDVIDDNLYKIAEASDTFQSPAIGRAMSIRRMLANAEKFDVASVVQKARTNKGGARLTPEEKASFTQMAEEHEALQVKYDDLLTKHEAEVVERSRLVAEEVAKIEEKKAAKKKTPFEKIYRERADLKKQLSEMGFAFHDITGVGAEGMYLLGRYVVNHIKEIVATTGQKVALDRIVKQIREELPALTERDVYDALNAKDPKTQAKAETIVNETVRNLKTQSRLLAEIEDLQNGIVERATKSNKKVQPDEIRELQKKVRELRSNAYQTGIDASRLEKAFSTLDDLQKQLGEHYRNVKKGKAEVTNPELKAVQEKIKQVRSEMRIEDALADANEQLRTKNYKVIQRPLTDEMPADISRTRVELKRKRREIRMALQDIKPKTPGRKLIDIFAEGANTVRTAQATADLSVTLRQLFVPMTKFPFRVGRALGKSMRVMFSENKAEAVMEALRGVDHQYIREAAGLHMPELGSRNLTQGNEMFLSNIFDKKPVLKQTYGALVRASERHMVVALNLARASIFDWFYEKYPNATMGELKAWADFVNSSSGRGTWASFKQHANKLSTVFFAPQFAASRIQIASLEALRKEIGWKDGRLTIKNPRVFKEVAKTYRNLGLTLFAAFELAKAAGYEVSIDPNDPDFGKIRNGDMHVDIMAGLQQPLRLAARVAYAAVNRNIRFDDIEFEDLGYEFDPWKAFTQFVSYKTAPMIGLGNWVVTRKNMIGQDQTMTDMLINSLTPFAYQSIIDAYRDKSKSMETALIAAGLEATGISTGVYNKDSHNSVMYNVRRLAADGRYDEAREIGESWNDANPKNRISPSNWEDPTERQQKKREKKENK